MEKITIDGVEYAFDKNADNPPLLQFALQQGIDIPYFCYHPAMSVPTNCRMCLVEVGFPMTDRATGEPLLDENGEQKIGWGRKPATSCNQQLAPNMIVKTNRTSEVIDKAQKGVLEFILINHPLDCPICDQAGECPLQINTYKYGPEGSRFELKKVHKPKRIELGPRVTLDAERCINCTRCTRFTEEVSGTSQLTIVERGDKNFPAAAPGTTFDDPYSMNVVDLCPVGALTSEDFRFKARVWEMNYTPNICTGCSKGCNVNVWVRDNKVLRLTPRENLQVNDYWMCDDGRLDYHKYNDARVSGIKLQKDVPVDFDEGILNAAELLQKHKGRILFVGSAHASLESNFALKEFAEELGAKGVYFVKHEDPNFGDNLLKRNDRTPNKAGCELLGFEAATIDDLIAQSRGFDLIYVMEDDAAAAALVAGTDKPVVAHAYQYFEGHEKAQLALPAATNFEAAGTYINEDNIPQMVQQAKQIRQMTPEMWMAMPKSRLDAGGVAVDNWRNVDNIIDCMPSWLMLNLIAREAKMKYVYSTHEGIFKKLQNSYELLKKLKIKRHNRKESFKMSQYEFAIDLNMKG